MRAEERAHPLADRRIRQHTSCLTRGASLGYQPQAYERAIRDVKAFLAEVFGGAAR